MIEGFYITCDDAVCVDCAPAGFAEGDYSAWEGFEEWREPLAIFASEESDSVTHCGVCGVVIEHDLTAEGYAAIRDAVADGFRRGARSPVVELWLDAYADYDDDLHPDVVDAYRTLPRDGVWLEREDLRRYALLAGWTD